MSRVAKGVSPKEAIAWLAEQRQRPGRQSFQTVEYGALVLEGGHLDSLGDDMWAFLEQLAIAALDLGRLDFAQLCVERLGSRFPESARVSNLQGMVLEAKGETGKALDYYNAELAKDETNLIIAKRRIAVMKGMEGENDPRGGLAAAIKALCVFLDTYYADPEGWQELASMYTSLHMYAQAAFALEEVTMLQPQNAFVVLQLAETQYTMGELVKAYTSYLRVLELCGKVEAGERKTGPWTRALWGLKATTTKLIASPKLTSGVQEAQKVRDVDALATDLLLNRAYATTAKSEGPKRTREAARTVLGGTSA